MWAQLQFRFTHWLQLDSAAAHLGAARPQARPNRADSVRHAQNLHFYRYFQHFQLSFVLSGSVQGNFAYTGPPTVSLSCVRLVRRKLDPKLGLSEDQGRASLTPVGFGWPKYAPPLSSLSSSLGAGSREATCINMGTERKRSCLCLLGASEHCHLHDSEFHMQVRSVI